MPAIQYSAFAAWAIILTAGLSGCDRRGSDRPTITGSKSAIDVAIGKRDSANPNLIELSKQMSVLEDVRAEGVLVWGGTVVIRRPDGYFEIDSDRARARPVIVKGLDQILDLAVSNGNSFALGLKKGVDRPYLKVRHGARWRDVEIPAEIQSSAGIWLAGGEGEPILVTPFEAYRKDGEKWRDYRFQGASARYREGAKFYFGNRLFAATRLGITGGELRSVDLGTTPRVWSRVDIPKGFVLTSLAADEKGVLWAGANRVVKGVNRAVLLKQTRGVLAPVTGIVFGDQEGSWPSLLGLISDQGRGELVALLSTGVAWIPTDGAGVRMPKFLVRFDFLADLFFDFARDSSGNFYLATEYSGVYQLRAHAAGDPELRRIVVEAN